MKLVTFTRADARERVGIVKGDSIADVTDQFPTMTELIASDQDGASLADAIAVASVVPLRDVRLLPPLPRPWRNVFCLGLNYAEHADEAEKGRPRNPIWFSKPGSTLCGPFDDIVIDPELSQQYDWEVELAVVIRRPGRRIGIGSALEHVHSYTVLNDFSARDIQLQDGGQWFKGKSLDASTPMGPWLVTADEIGDPQRLGLECRVNGITKQRSTTALMMFNVAACIADISQVLSLRPGDIISTGTPGGVGLARTPPEFLRPGDLMETEIERIGTLRNRIRAPGARREAGAHH